MPETPHAKKPTPAQLEILKQAEAARPRSVSIPASKGRTLLLMEREYWIVAVDIGFGGGYKVTILSGGRKVLDAVKPKKKARKK